MKTREHIVQDIRKASQAIQKRHRYTCGVVSDELREQIGCGDLFFESPDGQNGELYIELRNMGYKNGGYNAEYFWKVITDGWVVAYTEGDITIYPQKNDTDK
jgi:hypothetical protein